MARQWVLTGQEGYEKSLEFRENVSLPAAEELGPEDVLVSMRAASLNYRELLIPQGGGLHGTIDAPVVPGCDGAGVVEAVGSAVQEFKPGDRVVTYVAPKHAERNGDDQLPGIGEAIHCLGQGPDGTLCSKGVFSQKGLAHAPKSLDWITASTVPCTWLSAWNALFGLKGKEVGPGSWVLIEGTGGVSIASLQIAVAAGATVVATTSTPERAERLKKLGAAHVVNYRTNPDNWGQEARGFTPEGRGFDMIVDIGGDATLAHCLAAIRVEGVLVLGGFVGGEAPPVPLFSVFMSTCIVRPILAGSRTQLKEVIKFIDEKGVKPAVDDVVFELADTKQAYTRLKEKKHFSKVVIEVK